MNIYEFRYHLRNEHPALHSFFFHKLIFHNIMRAGVLEIANEICNTLHLDEERSLFDEGKFSWNIGNIPYQDIYNLLVKYENLILMKLAL